MAFGLSQKTIIQLRSVFKKHPEVTQVKIYGSRARGKYRRGSDIDLAFFSESEKDLSSNLSWELDDLPSPYLFDLVNYNTLTDSPLKKEIDKYGRVFYKKKNSSPSQQKSFSKKKTSKRQPLFPQKPSFQKKQEASNVKTSKTKNLFELKQTEIGTIPEGWEVCMIEKLFDLKQGKSLSSKNQTGLYLKPFLRTSNVFWGHLSLTKVDEMDIPEKERKALSLKKEDLLVCEGGDIGRTAIWNEELEECYYQNHIHRLRAKEKSVFPLFYMYWMDVAIRKLNIYGTFGNRTTIPNLPGKRLLKFKIPRPSFPEQKEIAGILSQIQEAIEVQNKLIETVKELKQATMKQLFTYGVKEQKTKQTEIGTIPKNQRAYRKQSNKASLSNKLDVSGNLKWPMVNLGDVADIGSGNSAPQDRSLFENGRHPFCRTSDVGKVHISDNFKEINDCLNNKGIKGLTLFKKNTILFPKSGVSTFLNHRVMLGTDSYISNHLATIYANKKKILPKFLFNFLCLVDAKKLTNDHSYPSLKLSEIKKIKIPCPPLPEQKEISDILTKVDQKIQIHKNKKSKLEELLKTMLNKLMTGKIRAHRLNINTNFLEQ